jgi:uroporphyrinogen-III synthase
VLSAELTKLGAKAIEVPAIEILPAASFGMLDDALRNIARFQWLIVTSANSVRVVQERCVELNLWPSDFLHLKTAAVGAATARAMEEAGFSVAVTPKEYVAESLLDALPEELRENRVLIARAEVARDVIPDALRARGARVDVVEAYRTTVPRESVAMMAEVFAARLPDAATFTSSSTVTNFFYLLREAGCVRPDGMLAVSIGPITSQTLRDHGWEPAAEADPHDVTGLVAAAVRVLAR